MAATPTAVPATPPESSQAAAPGLLRGTLKVFDLTLGEMLWSRRTVFMALIVGLPVVIALVVRLLVELGAPTLIHGVRVDGALLFGLMIWALFVRFIVPVLSAFYGTALIADEVEDRTLTYLFTRPIPRAAVLLGKYLAYLVATGCVVLPAVVLVWLLVAPIGGTMAESFVPLVKDLLVLAAGLAVYGALFAWIGATLRRPLTFGLLFVFGWEMLALLLPGQLKLLTVAYYLEGVVPHAMPTSSAVGVIQALFRDTPSLAASLWGLTAIGGASLALACRAVARREYVLDQ